MVDKIPQKTTQAYVPAKQPATAHIQTPKSTNVQKTSDDDLNNKIENAIHATFNDTEAAQLANSIADGKDQYGNPTISAKAFYEACAKHFPNVKPGQVTNCITVYNATGSFTQYAVQQQTYEKSQQRQELEAKGEKPKMGE